MKQRIQSKKFKEDSLNWFLAQEVISNLDQHRGPQRLSQGDLWKPRTPLWFKCNIGSSWSKNSGVGGGAWVLRNDKGIVLLHSRKAFVDCGSREEVKLQ